MSYDQKYKLTDKPRLQLNIYKYLTNIYVKVGTKLFVDELSKRIFSTADDIIMKVSFRNFRNHPFNSGQNA